MSHRVLIATAFAVAACKQDRVVPKPKSMADLVPAAARRPVEPPTAVPDPVAARMEAAAQAAEHRSDPAAMRAELRTRLGAPSLDLDGWIEWAVTDDVDCESVSIEHADGREVEHHRLTSVDGADLTACRALAAGDARARIIGSVAYAHGYFDGPDAARAWLRRNLGAPSRELRPADDHKSVWAMIIGDTCFTTQIDDAQFDRVITGGGYQDAEPEYEDCKRWSEGRGG